MPDIEVRGAEDIADLVKRIREHADAKALRKELFAGLNRATKDIRGELIEVIPASLPTRGGLADLVKSRVRSNTSAKAGKFAGVSMRFQAKGHDIRTLTGKRLRHPVFGNRNAWVDQTAGVEPSVFMAKFEEQTPVLQDAVMRVLNDIAQKVANG